MWQYSNGKTHYKYDQIIGSLNVKNHDNYDPHHGNYDQTTWQLGPENMATRTGEHGN